jgi:hypothetical protein
MKELSLSKVFLLLLFMSMTFIGCNRENELRPDFKDNDLLKVLGKNGNQLNNFPSLSKEELAMIVRADREYALVLVSVAENQKQLKANLLSLNKEQRNKIKELAKKIKLQESDIAKIEFGEAKQLLKQRNQIKINDFNQNDALSIQQIIGWDKIAQANFQSPFSFYSFSERLGKIYTFDKVDLLSIINEDLNAKNASNGRVEELSRCDALFIAAQICFSIDLIEVGAVLIDIWYEFCVEG